MTTHIDPLALRAAFRAQSDSRMPAHTAWALAFEETARKALTPLVQLFLQIMVYADSPCLAPTPELVRGHAHMPTKTTTHMFWGWTLHAVNQWTTAEDDPTAAHWQSKMDVPHTGILVCGPEFDGLQLADTTMALPAFAVQTPLLPPQSVVEGGEIVQPSALATAAIYMIGQDPEVMDEEPTAAADRLVQACRTRMLGILAAHELTFPDSDLTTAVWDIDTLAAMDVIAMQRAVQQRLASRQIMRLGEIALWLRGRLPNEDEYVTPKLTAGELAQVLALAQVALEQRKPRGFFARWKPPTTYGWLLRCVKGPAPYSGREALSYTATYVRPDGTVFDERLPERSRRPIITEHSPDRTYGASDLLPIKHSLKTGNR